MSITSFRLAREAQELKEKQEVEAVAPQQEACPMPAKEKPVAEEAATSTSSSTATVKSKPKTSAQK